MRQKKKTINTQQLMRQVLANPRYKGKHIVIAGNKIYATKTGEGAIQVLKRIRQKYPKVTPSVTYIPDADTLILW